VIWTLDLFEDSYEDGSLSLTIFFYYFYEFCCYWSIL